MVLFEKDFDKKVAFSFLNSIKIDLLRIYSIPQLSSLRMKGIPEFRVSIEKTKIAFQKNYNNKLLLIKNEVQELKEKMYINLDLLFKRNEKMDSLLDDLDNLQDRSFKMLKNVSFYN